MKLKSLFGILLSLILFSSAQCLYAQTRADAIIQKAIQNLGGGKYLSVKSQIGHGKFSLFKDNTVVSFQNFVDVIVFPDKERTEFRGGKGRTVQVNTGAGGWIFDGDAERLKDQDEGQIKGFKQGLRT